MLGGIRIVIDCVLLKILSGVIMVFSLFVKQERGISPNRIYEQGRLSFSPLIIVDRSENLFKPSEERVVKKPKKFRNFASYNGGALEIISKALMRPPNLKTTQLYNFFNYTSLCPSPKMIPFKHIRHERFLFPIFHVEYSWILG